MTLKKEWTALLGAYAQDSSVKKSPTAEQQVVYRTARAMPVWDGAAVPVPFGWRQELEPRPPRNSGDRRRGKMVSQVERQTYTSHETLKGGCQSVCHGTPLRSNPRWARIQNPFPKERVQHAGNPKLKVAAERLYGHPAKLLHYVCDKALVVDYCIERHGHEHDLMQLPLYHKDMMMSSDGATTQYWAHSHLPLKSLHTARKHTPAYQSASI
jgi:hypothetical protein